MNVDRLIQTYNHIIQHPESWNQKTWHCGTSHCFAGHGQINSGKEMNDETCFEDAWEWYGLSGADAQWLFDNRRTLPEMYAFVNAATKGDPYLYDYGYDHFGFNSLGYNRDGYDSYGYNRDGYSRDGFDDDGYNRDGFDREGYDRYGFDREGYDEYGFDDAGYDQSGNKLPLF